MKPRKLIPPRILHALATKAADGIPLARAMRQLDIDMTLPTAQKLVNYYHQANLDQTGRIMLSIHPAWLDFDGSPMQEQPATYSYVGYFPLGEWVHNA